MCEHMLDACCIMYSPKIDRHTPSLYRLAKLVGKPMTQVADDLIVFALARLDVIYEELDQQAVSFITQGADEHNNNSVD